MAALNFEKNQLQKNIGLEKYFEGAERIHKPGSKILGLEARILTRTARPA